MKQTTNFNLSHPSTEELRASAKEFGELSANLPTDINSGFLSWEQEKKLIRQYREKELDAWGDLLEGNIRFVILVAKNYLDAGLDMSRLVVAGTNGLVQAMQHYDESKGFRFLSYALWWIRHYIILEINCKS